MILRIDHVSIAVRDYEKAMSFFTGLMEAIPGAGADDDRLGFYWKIFSVGDLSRLEIISPTGDRSYLNGFLKNREGGVHHITFQTSDIGETIKKLDELKISYFGYNEYPGGIWKEVFIHPKDAFGVLVQIAEFTPDDWLSQEVKFSGTDKWEVKKVGNGTVISFSHPGGGKVDIPLTREEMKRLADELNRAF